MRTFHLLLFFASNWIDVSSNTDWENVFALRKTVGKIKRERGKEKVCSREREKERETPREF